MYKTSIEFCRHWRQFTKLLLTMKLVIALLLCSLFQAKAVSYAQNVTIHVKNASIADVLEEIGQQTKYDVLFNNLHLKGTKPINLNLDNVPLDQALAASLANESLTYEINNSTVIVYRKAKTTISKEGIQQTRIITGTVSDTTQKPIPEVTVRIKEKTAGVKTDSRGQYQISIPKGGLTLVFSAVGYETREITVNNRDVVNVTLNQAVSDLDEVVVVGYGTQTRGSVTAAVSSVNGEDLHVGMVGNVSNTIGGKVSGIITRQTSGEPGLDGASVLLRGTTPLVLVDGVERPWDKVNQADIESISMLKDASAVAPYGLKGANGVMLITTKRGSMGKVSLNYTGEYGYQKPMNTPEFMDAYASMSLRNTALIMDGKADQVVSEEVMNLYKQGTDEYPNTDWVGNYLKPSSSQQHNISASGGNEKTKAFLSLGYLDQGNMMGDTYGYKRYSIRSNVDIKPTPITTLSVDLSLINDQRRFQGISSSDLMLDLYRLPATEPDLYSNGLPAFSPTLGGSVYAQLHSGSNKQNNEFQNVSLTLNQEVPFIKGLSAKANFAYDKQLYKYKQWSEPYISYQLNTEGEYVEHNGWETSKPTLYEGDKFWTNYTFQGYLNYQNQFGKHHVQALAVYERRWGT